MKREEVKEVFKIIASVYPQFEVTSEKLDIWHRLLKDQNPAIVMRNAERYVLEQKFPPTIADIRSLNNDAYSNNFLKKVRSWEEVASGGKH